MDDITDHYRAHLALEGVGDKPRRKDVIRWAAQFPEAPSVSPATQDAYRFNWGDYATLSYTWGSETRRHQIVLNDRKVSVTENLAIALGAMARSGDYVGQFKLWIDAICINQDDELERASQVSKMRDIYSRAWAVVAWLGEERNYSHDAFNLLQRFADMTEESSLQAFGELRLPTILLFGKCFYGLNELMMRPYWSRLWIVQELVLGASSTILCCGDRRMRWNTFCDSINVLFRADMWIIKDDLLRADVERLGLSEEDYDSRWSTLWLHLVHKDLQVMSRYEEKGIGKLGLRRLLDIACSSDCRDTRDKVFALVGMMEPRIASSLVHDYSAAPAELFAAVSRAFIIHFNNLEPLREGNLGVESAPRRGPQTGRGRGGLGIPDRRHHYGGFGRPRTHITCTNQLVLPCIMRQAVARLSSASLAIDCLHARASCLMLYPHSEHTVAAIGDGNPTL